LSFNYKGERTNEAAGTARKAERSLCYTPRLTAVRPSKGEIWAL